MIPWRNAVDLLVADARGSIDKSPDRSDSPSQDGMTRNRRETNGCIPIK